MIEIKKGKRVVLGHCLGCHDRTIETVYEISFSEGRNSITIRLCHDCMKELFKKMAGVYKIGKT